MSYSTMYCLCKSLQANSLCLNLMMNNKHTTFDWESNFLPFDSVVYYTNFILSAQHLKKKNN